MAQMEVAEVNSVVSIKYKVIDKENGAVLDDNESGEPLRLLLGVGQVISGLESRLRGSRAGDFLSFDISPEEAYGNRDSGLLRDIPRSQFVGINLQRGMTLYAQSDVGDSTQQVVVHDFNGDFVTVDYNHPLAGKTLSFEVSVLERRSAEESEIATGSVSSCCGSIGSTGNQSMAGGSCCGGKCGCSGC